MVLASPISSIMCDHYPVPPITARPQVWANKKSKKKEEREGRGVLWERMCVSEPSAGRKWGKSERACVCRRSTTSHCHSIHPVISNYGKTQAFATASVGSLDLICSTPGVNQPLTRWSTARHGLLFSFRICWNGLWGVISCIWGRKDHDSKLIIYQIKSNGVMNIRSLLLWWTRWKKCGESKSL